MIYTEKTKKAMEICFEAHKKQVDKSGIPYVFHPIHLAEQMTTEETNIVALLQDVVEDSDITFEYLENEGFDKAVIDAVKLLTQKDKSVKYEDYVKKIKTNPIAKAVKLADLAHNSDITRLDVVTEKDLERREKYLEAIEILKEE